MVIDIQATLHIFEVLPCGVPHRYTVDLTYLWLSGLIGVTANGYGVSFGLLLVPTTSSRAFGPGLSPVPRTWADWVACGSLIRRKGRLAEFVFLRWPCAGEVYLGRSA